MPDQELAPIPEVPREPEVLLPPDITTRDREYEFFKRAIETAYANAAAQLELRARQLDEEIKDDFYKRVQRIAWAIGVLGLVATLGGFVSINSIVKSAVDDQIRAQQQEIDKLKATAMEDVVELRTEARVAASESKRTAEDSQKEVRAVLSSVKTDMEAQSREMNQQIASAKQLGLDMVAWWESIREIPKAALRDAKKQSEAPATDSAASEPKKDYTKDPQYLIMKCLKTGGVNDADVDLWISVMEGNAENVKAAMEKGGNPVARFIDVVRRHKDVLMKNCPGLAPSSL